MDGPSVQRSIKRKKNFFNFLIIQASLRRMDPTAGSPSIKQLAPRVREFLEKTMEKLKHDHPWRRNMQYELCVACTSCSKGKCETWKVADGTDDSLHLIEAHDGNPVCRKSTNSKPKICGIHLWFSSPVNKVMANISSFVLCPVRNSTIFCFLFYFYFFGMNKLSMYG